MIEEESFGGQGLEGWGMKNKAKFDLDGLEGNLDPGGAVYFRERRERIYLVENEHVLSVLLTNGHRGRLAELIHWEGCPADAVARAVTWDEPRRCWMVIVEHPTFKALSPGELAPLMQDRSELVELDQTTLRQHTLIAVLKSEVEDLARQLGEARERIKELEGGRP